MHRAAAAAATRVWSSRGTALGQVFDALPLEAYRLRATDIDWSVGAGPIVEGPIGALLLLLTGRRAALAQVTGAGAEALRETVAA